MLCFFSQVRATLLQDVTPAIYRSKDNHEKKTLILCIGLAGLLLDAFTVRITGDNRSQCGLSAFDGKVMVAFPGNFVKWKIGKIVTF